MKIVFFCMLAAVGYGILHDQITARVCVEYFTIGHPPVFNTDSPTLLGLGWGVLATWWVGLFLGIPLAVAARAGKRAKLRSGQLVRPVLALLGIMACLALASGITGYVLASRGVIRLPDFLAAIPASHRVRFLADWWAHMASYASGFFGGLTLIVWSWRRRNHLALDIPPSGCVQAVPPG